MVSGATRLAAVVGDPIRHSLSPAILNAAFEAAGLDWLYVAFQVPEGEGRAAVDAVRTLGLGGLSVTMPHKAVAAAACDELTGVAKALGAANCLYWQGTTLCGDNTDGAGFLDALRLDEGIDPAGARCVIVGAGGAGRAVAHALGEADAGRVVIVNRSPRPAEHAARLAGPAGVVGAPHDVAGADIVVNATPLGMGTVVATDGSKPLPLDVDLLTSAQVIVDLIYDPATTPLLAAAHGRGARTVNGLGMLIHQAAHAFRRWTSEEPALEAMSAAALRQLARRTADSGY